jgi:GNAT superfamily N-acetyltransferase
MNPNIQVRRMIPADLPQLMGLDHSSITDHVWQLEVRRDPHGPQISTAFREVRLPREVALVYPNDPFALADDWMRKAVVLVAVADKVAVGYAAITEPRAGIGWISDLVVTARRRRQGIAGGLLESARDWCSERGNTRLFIEMQSKNYPTIKLAQKHGYEFCGYNDNYYSTQDIALFFVKAV